MSEKWPTANKYNPNSTVSKSRFKMETFTVTAVPVQQPYTPVRSLGTRLSRQKGTTEEKQMEGIYATEFFYVF